MIATQLQHQPGLSPNVFARLRQLIVEVDPCEQGFHCDHARCAEHCCECGLPQQRIGR